MSPKTSAKGGVKSGKATKAVAKGDLQLYSVPAVGFIRGVQLLLQLLANHLPTVQSSSWTGLQLATHSLKHSPACSLHNRLLN